MRGTLVRASPVPGLRLSARAAQLVDRLAPLACRAVAVAATVPLLLYVWVALHRLSYPYELDWLEGGGVEIVARVLHGQPLYTTPTLGYVSYTYPPLYPLLSAAVAELTGVGFLPLRLLSFISSLCTVGLLWRWVRTVSADRLAGVVAGGLFAASYALTGWWFDVGRLDSMYVALTVAALLVGRSARGWRGAVAFGGLAFLAFFTKQIALVAVAPAMVCLILQRRRPGLIALAVLAVLVAGSTLILDAVSNGWYRYFVVNELSGQAWVSAEWGDFWRSDLIDHLWPLVLLGAAAAASALARRERPAIAYELAAAFGLLFAACFSVLHTGGYLNVLIPAYVATALLGGIAFAGLRRRGSGAALLAAGLVALQLVVLPYDDGRVIPGAAANHAGAALIARLRTLPGPVLVLSHPWYGTLAGKGSFAQADAIREVLRSQAPRGRSALSAALRGSLNRYHVQAVLLDNPPPVWLAPELARDFTLQPGAPTTDQVRAPADIRTWPEYLYLRRR